VRRHWLFLVFIGFATAAHAQKPQIQWDPDYDFSAVKTFAWRATPETELQQKDPFMHSRVVAAIEYQLTSAGLTQVESAPDVWVTYHTNTENKVRLQSDSYGYGFGGYGLGGWGYWGYGPSGPISTTTRVIEYEQNTLIVDMWDAASMQLVLRGAVTRVFSQSPQTAAKQVDKAVARMAAQTKKLMSRK